MLELNTSIKDEVFIIELEGVLDSRTASDFKSWFEERMLDGYYDFVLDFLSLEYLSSRGIGVLTELNNFLRSKGGRMAICHASDEIIRLLRFLKIDAMIKICSGAKDAVSEVHKMRRETTHTPGNFNVKTEQIPAGSADNLTAEENLSSEEKITEKTDSETNKNFSEKDLVQEKYAENKKGHSEESSEKHYNTRIIFCQNCGQRLRVNKPGKYLCPSCKINFFYNQEN